MNLTAGYNRSSQPFVSSGLAYIGVPQTLSALVQSLNAPTASPMNTLMGANYTNFRADVNALAAGGNAPVNLQSAGTANKLQNNVTNMAASFKAEATKAQAPLIEALKKGAVAEGYNPAHAINSFAPPLQNDAMDLGLNAAYHFMGIGSVMMLEDAFSTARKASGSAKLTSAQESMLAARVQAQLSPTYDIFGNVAKPPALVLPNGANERLAHMKPAEFEDFLKKALCPPEEQPEYKAMMDVQEQLRLTQGAHAEMKPANDAVCMLEKETGIKVKTSSAPKTDDIKNTCSFLRDSGVKGLKIQSMPANVAALSDDLRKKAAPEPQPLSRPPFQPSAMPVFSMCA